MTLTVQCESCRKAVELVSEGLSGFWGYQTYNEYFCPHCRKRNFARTPGAILSAGRPGAAADSRPANARRG